MPLGSGAEVELTQMNSSVSGLSQQSEPVVVQDTAMFPVKISALISGFVV